RQVGHPSRSVDAAGPSRREAGPLVREHSFSRRKESRFLQVSLADSFKGGGRKGKRGRVSRTAQVFALSGAAVVAPCAPGARRTARLRRGESNHGTLAVVHRGSNRSNRAVRRSVRESLGSSRSCREVIIARTPSRKS